MSPMVYLSKQLGFKMSEWGTLTDSDKNNLKQWAVEEMTLLGIEIK
jgi:hypothetical protein